VVTWNSAGRVAECLDSLREPGVRVETVVVDNASADGTLAVVRSASPGARVIETGSNLGFAAAANRGIRAGTGAFVLLLNPDARLLPGSLARLREALAGRPGGWAAGPAILDGRGRPRRTDLRFPRFRDLLAQALFLDRLFPPGRPAGRGRRGGGGPGDPVRVDWLPGCCVLLRRSALDRAGLLDERYFLYFEETDWFRRVAAAGGAAYWCPEAEAVHHGGGVGHFDEHRVLPYHRSLLLYWARHHPGTPRVALRALVALRAAARLPAWSAAWLLVPGLRARAASCLRGWTRVLSLALWAEAP